MSLQEWLQRHRRTVRDRLIRLNPVFTEGQWPRGWHPKRSAKYLYIMTGRRLTTRQFRARAARGFA